jgi:hemolysin III
MIIERKQTPDEEKLNTITHVIGFILALFGSVYLINQSFNDKSYLTIFCNMIYSSGLLTLYLASSLYHSAKDPELKMRLNIFDHSAIYLLIAGTYTPVALMTIKGVMGLIIFGIVWILAIVGIVMKLYFTGRYSKISTVAYVLMGWVIIIAIKPLINSMVTSGLLWLLAGGIFYTFGALLYQRKSMKYNHVLFHIFVILGSLCHYIVILKYV